MVDYEVDGKFALLKVNNPPVNALSYNVRQGLHSGIAKATKNDQIKAIIIIGKGRTFPSGADITEFGKPVREPWLGAVGRDIENSHKPVIAALHGTCLGGGLEIALFSHYRVAIQSTRIGFPEVSLGILPGAEGTVRLPRITGAAVAMDLISSGRPIKAQQAHQLGIIDKIVDKDLLSGAKSFAESILDQPLEQRRLKNVIPQEKDAVDQIYEVALSQVKKKASGFIAPVACLQAVRGSVKLSYEEACDNERSLIMDLMTGGQAKALQYAFFAERAATKWSLPSGANSSNTKPASVESVGVIGAGTMGSGIAICCLRVGIPVILVERDEKMLDKGLNMISTVLSESVKRKRMSVAQRTASLKLLKGSVKLDILHSVDVVIEAVFENLELKKEIFAKLDKICKPSAILCSNTSSLNINQIASATSRPGQVMGAHFFSPAYIMKLLENIYGEQTSPQTIATLTHLGKKIGKMPVLVKTCPSFVANRMNQKLSSEAGFLLEEGALPQDVDRVMENFGMPVGPFKVGDIAGNDISWFIRKERAKERGVSLSLGTKFVDGERYSSLADRLCEAGRFGRKTGKGWYLYQRPMATVPYQDEEVTNLILEHSKALGIERRQITDQEILERCTYAMINEGFKILEEGIAAKPEDIDTIWLYGFGFPRYRGGPMFHASMIGLDIVYERVCHYHRQLPYSSYWTPSDLLRQLAAQKSKLPISQWGKFASSKL